AARVHVRPRLPRRARQGREPPCARHDREDRRAPRRAGRLSRRDRRVRCRDDRPLRTRLRLEALMARIKDTSVEPVQAAADIVTLVEGYTRLRKAGRSLRGLCPFHQEKTPSFYFTPDRGTFKCFGCGEGGDAISFVEKKENLDFVGSIEWLADRFGVQLEYGGTSPEQDRARKHQGALFQPADPAAQ